MSVFVQSVTYMYIVLSKIVYAHMKDVLFELYPAGCKAWNIQGLVE